MNGRILDHTRLRAGLNLLADLDPSLQPIILRCGDVPLRKISPDFAGLARVIVGQLISVAAAGAIISRLEKSLDGLAPQSVAEAEPEKLRDLGLTQAKAGALHEIATLVVAGELDLPALENLPSDAAISHLMALRGVGGWTAEVFALSAFGYGDIFPSGDLALRKVVSLYADAPELMSSRDVDEFARQWSPVRAVAARLFWRYFAISNTREGLVI